MNNLRLLIDFSLFNGYCKNYLLKLKYFWGNLIFEIICGVISKEIEGSGSCRMCSVDNQN